jgi:ABC-type dipeptide/oligopeptide/nickel transport system permease component
VFVIANTVVDIVQMIVDPRLRKLA